MAWSALASILLHGVMMAVAMTWPSLKPIPPQPEQEFAVELVAPDEISPEVGVAAAPATASPPPDSATAPPTPAPTASAPLGMIVATTMLSARALADPTSRQAREMLPTFEGTERMVQLCDLEAIEQVRTARPEFRPERIVAYAMAALSIAGGTVQAEGAAFRSGGHWHNLRFTCALSPDRKWVVSFAFAVGEPIPEEQLVAHNLTMAD